MFILDYSQYKVWSYCQAAWLDKYHLGVQKVPKPGQKSDVLTLGSLVHQGLQFYRESGRVGVPQDIIDKLDPTPECVTTAASLIYGYVKTYPDELFTKYYCEHPLKFPLTNETEGLAKIDSYFEVTERTSLNQGLNGELITLEPGWWIHEYKTKDPSSKIGNYMQGWAMNQQADFQMLALSHFLSEPVQGIFVNVLEKEKLYVPQHKCKGCGTESERRNWSVTIFDEEKSYTCPICGHQQQLKFGKEGKSTPAQFYRIPVSRTKEQLDYSLYEITETAKAMESLRKTLKPLRSTERCVDRIFGPCEYFPPHVSGQSAMGYDGFVQVDDPLSYTKN